MYIDNDKHIESSKINYLLERGSMIEYEKLEQFQKTFNLVDDQAPQSASELVKRITDGKYLLSKENEDKKVYDPVRFIRWRDPAKVEDKAGFEAAKTAFKVVAQDTRDTIQIGTPAEGLVAIKALDAWTPTVTA